MGKHALDIDTQAKGKTVKTVGQYRSSICLKVETDVVSITYRGSLFHAATTRTAKPDRRRFKRKSPLCYFRECPRQLAKLAKANNLLNGRSCWPLHIEKATISSPRSLRCSKVCIPILLNRSSSGRSLIHFTLRVARCWTLYILKSTSFFRQEKGFD